MNKEKENNFPKVNIKKQIEHLYKLVCDLYGTEKVVLKASKLDSLNLLKSKNIGERVLAIQKIIYENPTFEDVPNEEEIPIIIEELEEKLAEIMAKKTFEDNLELKIAEKMHEKNEEYIEEIKMQIIKDNSIPENAQTLRQLALLEKKDEIKLAKTAMEVLRPKKLKEIIGQEKGVQGLISKIASPFPQHIIVYGPPGIGKTSAARLALETAKKIKMSAFDKEAPFIEVDGTTLRWDPRDVTNPLLGSVHDPIYQGAKKDFADTGIPEPKLGLVTDAHGGILFIDEIGEMDPLLLNKLLKVLEDKKVHYDSSYYDPEEESIPKYIKKIFEDGAPADFILIGATTRDPGELNPALRSRCTEIYFEPLSPRQIQKIIINSAKKLDIKIEPEVSEIISQYTIEGRKANNILSDAYGLSLYKKYISNSETDNFEKLTITKEDIIEVVQISRLTPYIFDIAKSSYEIGKIFGLGVSGFIGSTIEIESVVFPAFEKGKGKIRFNETAGSMAKDSVFNASSVIRKIANIEVRDYDIHINVVGGGQIDGPSAGVAICLALLSSLQDKPLRQDIAVTGELSIKGKVKPVGGIPEKIYGAKQAGIKTVLVPINNQKDIPIGLKDIEVKIISTIEEAIEFVFGA